MWSCTGDVEGNPLVSIDKEGCVGDLPTELSNPFEKAINNQKKKSTGITKLASNCLCVLYWFAGSILGIYIYFFFLITDFNRLFNFSEIAP